MATENADTFKLTLKGDGIDITKSIDAELARDVITLLLGGKLSSVPIQNPLVKEFQREKPRLDRDTPSMREYLDECRALRNPDKILTIAQYLVEFEGKGLFSKDDVKVKFRAAREPAPANLHRDWDSAARSGWIAEDTAEPGQFYITQKGKQAIAAKFSADVKKPVNRNTKRRNEKRVGNVDSEKSETLGKQKKKSASNANGFKRIPDLDLNPKGEISFADFAAEKNPQSNEDKYVLIVYYLEQKLNIKGISLDHVGTVFRLAPGWREPGNLRGGINMAASRKNTIDTTDYSNLKTTPQGRNFVEHDLPARSVK